MINICIFNKSNDAWRFDIFKKFFECINSKISLRCCTETGAVYQNVLTVRREWQIWHSGWFSPFRRYELLKSSKLYHYTVDEFSNQRNNQINCLLPMWLSGLMVSALGIRARITGCATISLGSNLGQVVYSHCLPSFSAPRNWRTKRSFRRISGYGD